MLKQLCMETRTLFVVRDHDLQQCQRQAVWIWVSVLCSCLVVNLEGITNNVLITTQLHKSCSTNTTLVSKNASTWTLVFLVLVLRIYSCFVASIFSLKVCIISHFWSSIRQVQVEIFLPLKNNGVGGRVRKENYWKQNSQTANVLFISNLHNLYHCNSPNYTVVAE